MRFAPDGHAVAFTAGYGGGGLSIQIRTVADPAVAFAVLPAGHDPRWIGPRHLIARSPDGLSSTATVAGYVCDYVGANDDDLDATSGRTAYAPDRSQGVRVYQSGVEVQTFPGTFEPGLSPGGTLALRDLGTGEIRLARLVGCLDTAASNPALGPGTRPRWSSQSIVFDSVPFGRVLGRTSPDQATVDLSVPDRASTHPVVLWTGSRLFVGAVLDEGLLVVADWGSLQNRERLGWIVGSSGGSAFDWDLAVAAWSVSVVLVAFLNPDGTLALVQVDTASTPPVDLGVEQPEPPIPPEPVEPPEPIEPPEPVDPPIEPVNPDEVEDMNPTVDMIPRDQTVMAGDAIDEYLRGNPRLGLPDGIWPSDFDAVGNAERLDVISAYLIGEWCPEVCRLGPFPGDAAGWDTRRNLGLDHTFHVIEAERGEPAPGPEPIQPGVLRGPIGTDRRWFTVPD